MLCFQLIKALDFIRGEPEPCQPQSELPSFSSKFSQVLSTHSDLDSDRHSFWISMQEVTAERNTSGIQREPLMLYLCQSLVPSFSICKETVNQSLEF